MAFNRAHSFTINVQWDFNQVDKSGREHEMQALVNEACPGASHESAERADAPRCHPDTRKDIISEIMNWVDSSDQEKRIMWLSAAAGAGKTSIAQTIAEMCSRDGKLLSSFFFSRTATGSGRDDGNKLIPTIAYHLAVSIPETRDLITSEVEHDPAMFKHSMDVQLKKLVIDPIMRVVKSGDVHTPFVVIIDGLDECNAAPDQSRIISAIAKSISETSSHIRVFFASRPEREIRKMFDLPSVENITKKLSLIEDEEANSDIKIYLSLIPSRNTFFEKSSGHFIYASTVMKYIADDDQDPREALNAILDRSMTEVGPFAELDALYSHILLTAASRTKGGYNAIFPILKVLALIIDEDVIKPIGNFAEFLGVTESALTLSMTHLHSIIYIDEEAVIKFHHASFKDFLLDPSRSKDSFIGLEQGHLFLGDRCLALLKSKPRQSDPAVYAARFFLIHLKCSKFNIQLLNEFLHIADLRSMMSMMIDSESFKYNPGQTLRSIFSIDFDRLDDFAVPNSVEMVDICKRVSDALDDLVLQRFNIRVLQVYANLIDGIYGSLYDRRFICNWAFKIMDIPERGKHMHISDEKAKSIILSILDVPIGHSGVSPRVFLHFFKRIKPSEEFGSDIRKCLPHVERFIGRLDSPESVLSTLKECGLEKEVNEINEIIEYSMQWEASYARTSGSRTTKKVHFNLEGMNINSAGPGYIDGRQTRRCFRALSSLV